MDPAHAPAPPPTRPAPPHLLFSRGAGRLRGVRSCAAGSCWELLCRDRLEPERHACCLPRARRPLRRGWPESLPRSGGVRGGPQRDGAEAEGAGAGVPVGEAAAACRSRRTGGGASAIEAGPPLCRAAPTPRRDHTDAPSDTAPGPLLSRSRPALTARALGCIRCTHSARTGVDALILPLAGAAAARPEAQEPPPTPTKVHEETREELRGRRAACRLYPAFSPSRLPGPGG
ncbi:hypothetical protein B0H15DRAFT_970418 [Mycena belliarum]|uniref:Uncharacterized protein n=1 Tax=Mycena belliarum TaxID=1033014 RepID=A0AAD6XKX9_9AGAR|nr:hypothetical protein B0H15DRAFT_970418 [Mycena belliae]